MIKVHVSGVDRVVKELRELGGNIEDALDEACTEAAEHLRDSISDKFGYYQDGWDQLKPDTINHKGGSDEPLIESGDMMFSFEIETSNSTRKHTATVYSEDEKLLHHVYGAPNANVPMRDPVRPTTKEEKDECIKIIKNKVKEVWHA